MVVINRVSGRGKETRFFEKTWFLDFKKPGFWISKNRVSEVA
jgi:hypothetical protein